MQPNTSKTIARFEAAWQEACGTEPATRSVLDVGTLPVAQPEGERPPTDKNRSSIAELKSRRANEHAATPARQFPRGARVLVVDDLRIVRETVAMMVKSFGLEPILASSAAEAHAAIADPLARLDLIITDLMMPDMDGRSLIDSIRVQRPRLNAILTSGCFDDPIAADTRQPEPDAPRIERLAKPFSLAQFRGVMLSLIGVPAQIDLAASPALAA